jgi:hypothetical protein
MVWVSSLKRPTVWYPKAIRVLFWCAVSSEGWIRSIEMVVTSQWRRRIQGSSPFGRKSESWGRAFEQDMQWIVPRLRSESDAADDDRVLQLHMLAVFELENRGSFVKDWRAMESVKTLPLSKTDGSFTWLCVLVGPTIAAAARMDRTTKPHLVCHNWTAWSTVSGHARCILVLWIIYVGFGDDDMDMSRAMRLLLSLKYLPRCVPLSSISWSADKNSSFNLVSNNTNADSTHWTIPITPTRRPFLLDIVDMRSLRRKQKSRHKGLWWLFRTHFHWWCWWQISTA